jgi:signal transduction histidine kinase
MASAISSHARSASTLDDLADAVRAAVPLRPAVLLVVRVAEFERVAWREGKAAARRLERRTHLAFRAAASRVLRCEDRTGHDCGSDVFAAAMLGAPRERRTAVAADCRAAVERIAFAIRDSNGLSVESGWTLVDRPPSTSLHAEVERALERGARERERYAFFAAVGHELRTPLTSISGYLETLLDEELDPTLRRRFVQTAGREASRLGRLIESMLDFSMLDLSQDAPSPASCNLAEQIGVACDAVAPHAAQRAVCVERRAIVSVCVGLSPDRCAQALINLLDNAIAYGRSRGRVRVSCDVRAPYARVRVDDDGEGLRDEVRGHGIGLSIVKIIIERAGGELRAARSPMGGARFELKLPLRADAQPVP